MNARFGCPHRDECFIIASLAAVPIPSLKSYCENTFLNCRYYQRLTQAVREEKLKEVCA